MTKSIYIPRGVNVYSLSRETNWHFEPTKQFKVKRGFTRMYFECLSLSLSLSRLEVTSLVVICMEL